MCSSAAGTRQSQWPEGALQERPDQLGSSMTLMALDNLDMVDLNPLDILRTSKSHLASKVEAHPSRVFAHGTGGCNSSSCRGVEGEWQICQTGFHWGDGCGWETQRTYPKGSVCQLWDLDSGHQTPWTPTWFTTTILYLSWLFGAITNAFFRALWVYHLPSNLGLRPALPDLQESTNLFLVHCRPRGKPLPTSG